jgi:hypothetical protein
MKYIEGHGKIHFRPLITKENTESAEISMPVSPFFLPVSPFFSIFCAFSGLFFVRDYRLLNN